MPRRQKISSNILNLVTWKDIFSSLSIWDGQEVKTERIVGLKIFGVSLLLRDELTFNKIAELFGRVVSSSDFSWNDDDVSVGRVIILASPGDLIKEEIQLSWKNNIYNVWVREDLDHWSPEYEDHLESEEELEFDREEDEFELPASEEAFPADSEQSGWPPAFLGGVNNFNGVHLSKTASHNDAHLPKSADQECGEDLNSVPEKTYQWKMLGCQRWKGTRKI